MIFITSNGKEYNLKSGSLKLKVAAFRKYAWKAEVTERLRGVTVNRFKKEPLTYEAKLYIGGAINRRKQAIEEFYNDIEADVFNKTAGRLVYSAEGVGESKIYEYAEAYIIGASVEPDGMTGTAMNVTIYVPSGMWIDENVKTFPKVLHGYNLLPTVDHYDYGRERTANGITYHVNDDGSITANGTSTASAPYVISHYNRTTVILPAGTYTVGGCSGGSTSTYRLYFAFYYADNTFIETSTYGGATRVMTITEPARLHAQTIVNADTVLDNVIFYPMVERGSVAHDYEPPTGGGGGGVEGFLDYPHNYPYNYKGVDLTSQTWNTGAGYPTDFVLTVYGKATNPSVTINGHIYQVNGEIATGEYLKVDTENGTIYKVTNGGNVVNMFDNRNKASDIFKQIDGGEASVTWSGDFTFDITQKIARSMPLWLPRN